MKRTSLAVALAGAAVLLVGCGSNSAGSPSIASSTTSTVASTSDSSTAAGTATSESSSESTESTDSSSESSESTDSSSESTESTESTDSSSESTDSSSEDTSSEESTSDSSEESSTSESTAGDQSGQLDEQSTAWFDKFCTTAAPFVEQIKSASDLGGSGSDPETAKAAIVKLYQGLGATMTETADAVRDLPPPTFQGGDKFAEQIIKTFTELGPKFTATAKKVAAEPASKITSSIGSLGTDLQSASTAIQLTPETEQAIQKIPSCAKLQG